MNGESLPRLLLLLLLLMTPGLSLSPTQGVSRAMRQSCVSSAQIQARDAPPHIAHTGGLYLHALACRISLRGAVIRTYTEAQDSKGCLEFHATRSNVTSLATRVTGATVTAVLVLALVGAFLASLQFHTHALDMHRKRRDPSRIERHSSYSTDLDGLREADARHE